MLGVSITSIASLIETAKVRSFISITDVWAAGQLGSEVQASIGIIAQTQMLLLSIVMAASSGAVASISQSLGAKKYIRAQRYIGLVVFTILLYEIKPYLIEALLWIIASVKGVF